MSQSFDAEKAGCFAVDHESETPRTRLGAAATLPVGALGAIA
jgi:hypothetical protein